MSPHAPNRFVLVAAKVVAAFLGFSALVTEIATLVARHSFVAGDFFSYFTVESNALAVLSLVLSGFAATSGRSPRSLELFRGAVSLYMTTTISIFIVLLSGYPSSELTAVPWDNTVLHYVMPIVVIVDWLVDAPRRAVAYRSALLWLTFPLAYLGYSLVRGHVVHWYPYPFMNPAHHGYLGIAVTSVVIAVVLAVVTWLLSNSPRVLLSRR